MNEDDFAKECFRCGRCIEIPGENIWRWTAFHFGLDLIISLDTTSLRFTRFHKPSEHIKANHNEHNIILK